MTICITSTGDTLDHEVDPHFGRSTYFIFVDTETLEHEAIPNPNTELGGGAGIQSGQLMSSRGVDTVLTGNVGPNAYRTLQAAGVRVYTGVYGTVQEAVRRFKKGEFPSAEGPSVGSKFGMG